MYREYPISKELEESSWKDNLFIDFIPVSSDPDHSVVLCVVCAKEGKRVVRGGEVFGEGQDSPFLQAMENAKVAALSVFYGKALPDLDNGKKTLSEQATPSPNENHQPNSNLSSGETADQNRAHSVSGNNLTNQTEPMKAAPSTTPAGQAENSATGRQNSTPGNRQNTASANRQQAASSNRQSAGSTNRQSAASANRQQAASQNRQTAPLTNRQTVAPQQPSSSPQQSAPAAAAGPEGAGGMSGDDDFRVIIGPYAKKENNYISWIVANDLDFIRRICNLTNPLPTYADTIEKIKTYVTKHGIVL